MTAIAKQFVQNAGVLRLPDQPGGYVSIDSSGDVVGTYYRAPKDSAPEIEIPHRSNLNLNGIFAGSIPVGRHTFQFSFNRKDRIVQSMNVLAGWNAYPFTFDGLYSSIFLNGK